MQMKISPIINQPAKSDAIPELAELELSIVMPCLNEAETLATCIRKAQSSLKKLNVAGEVIVADNGSTDGSQTIATEMGARVVTVATKGYGSALMGGIAAARGKYIIMGDADDSYDFANLDEFFHKLQAGYDLVMGNRFKGGIQPRAMPRLHQYLGNPALTGMGRLFFHSPCGDFHCGLRGFSRDSVMSLGLQATGKATFNLLWTYLWMPCVTLPFTKGPIGLPVGIQLVGRQHEDAALLDIAAWARSALT